ncbi:MAG: carbohydrate binding family 9 domain-containing protein [Acidimicrobiia bacterium]|nr:carbohydrate binding family 9 domain-containing protein [Acidimicrobiia bacterium]
MRSNRAGRVLRVRRAGIAAVALCAVALAGGPVDAQPPAGAASRDSPSGPAVSPDGLPLPQLPETIARDAERGVTIRAVRLTQSLNVDGALDEVVYRDLRPASGFIQTEPVAGTQAVDQTEVWVFFDDNAVYFSARCYDSAPESDWVANEMRRDNFNVFQGDNLGILVDTFRDRRNGIVFNINALGGRLDGQMFDERAFNADWNPIYELATGRFDGGWTLEVALPFKSFRYGAGRQQVWGLQFRRSVRRTNEHSYLAPLPAEQGSQGLFMSSMAAALVGIEAPEGGRTLEFKPYAIANLTSDAARGVSNDPGGDAGLDVKYAVTQGIVGDLTVNTDFAQVEADEQQVNLTRFSLFFPEKREFFLENQGLFTFGGAGARGGGATPVLFYSRQIGLFRGQAVPLDVGGRLTGRVGRFSLGVLNIQAGEAPQAGAPSTNFSVVRVRRDILRRSSVGLLFTGRSRATTGQSSAETYGVDGLLSFYDNVNINTYWAKTSAPGRGTDDVSYRGQYDYVGDRYGLQVDRIVIGKDFDPQVGFLPRGDLQRLFVGARISPRPLSIAAVRKFRWVARFEHIADRDDVLETREVQGDFAIEFENSDHFLTTYSNTFEFLDRPFPIAPGVTIPVGGYDFQDVETSYTLGQQRRLSGRLSAQYGRFFSGHKTTLGFSQGRLELTPRFSLEPSYSYNRVNLPQGRFTTQLVRTRTTYTLTPLMFVSALVQYNSSSRSFSTNARLRWEYTPGSELFVVYDEDRNTDPLTPDRFTELRNRAFVVKINRLLRF